MKTPINKEIAGQVISGFGIKDYGKATIRGVVAISNELENKTGLEFIHMVMGVPGLPASNIGIEAEINALNSGVASIYPIVYGYPDLKKQASSFVKEIGRAHV